MKQAFKARCTVGANTTETFFSPEKGLSSLANTLGTANSINYGMVVAAPGTVSRLSVFRMNAALALAGPGAGNSETWTMHLNGVATSLTCSVSDTSTNASDIAHTVSIVPGDVITLVRTYSGSAPGASTSHAGWLFTGTVPLRSMHGGNFSPNAVATAYVAPMSMFGASQTTRLDYRATNIVGVYGSVTGLFVRASVAPGAAKSWTVSLLKNGVEIAESIVTLSGAGSTTGSSTFDTSVVPVIMDAGVAISAADQLSIQIVPVGGPPATQLAVSLRFDATALEFVNTDTMVVIAEIADSISNFAFNGSFPGGNSYFDDSGLQGSPLTLQTRFPDVDGPDFNVSLAYLGVQLTTGPGAGSGRTFKLQSFDGSNFVAQLAGGNPEITGTNTFGGTSDVGGATQFMSYGATDNGRRFAMAQIPASVPAATDCFCAAMAFVGSFDASALEFDGAVTSITPSEGPVAGGTAFTITGSGFQGTAGSGGANITGVSGVTLRGVAATSVMVVNDTTITGTSAAGAAGIGDVIITFTTSVATASIATLSSAWTYVSAASWWYNPEDDTYIQSVDSPGDPYIASASAPQPYGYWLSSEGMAGGPTVADGTRVPKGPRTAADVAVFATGAAYHLQGVCSVVYRNKLIYAARGYSGDPTIRIYDGQTDRFLIGVPKDASAVSAVAVMSMLAANGTIYISTLDAAAGGGRVLQFDLDSNTFTPMGTAFGSGEVPYAMCWHMGRLWVGTNDGDGSACAVYFIRPEIDAAFTNDHALSGDSLGGVASMASYKGKLYIGTDNIATANGKVLVRSELGVYSVSETGSGTAAMNGYVAMCVFGENLYAAYWNSVGAVSTIRKFNNSAWSTVYTGASGTAHPVFALFLHGDFLYALFGAAATAAALIRSDNGSSYTDLSAFLTPVGTILATPAYGSLRL